MKPQILDGKKLAAEIEKEITEFVTDNLEERGRAPILEVILIGNRQDSALYVRNKMRTAARIGISCHLNNFADNVTSSEVEEVIQRFNENKEVDGIIIQLPLPKHLDRIRLVQLIDPKKDVDGLHSLNMGALASVSNVPYHIPCTPQAVLEIIRLSGVPLRGAHVVLVGCGELVGRPLALCLLRENATVTCCHIDTKHIETITKQGDIVVVAIGCPELITKEWIKPGAVVIDVGINSVNHDGQRRLTGDVHFESVASIAGAITPVPGGVGPMTVIMLMKAVVKSWIKKN